MNRLKNFVESGYKKKGDVKNVNGMVLDEELSTRRNKVYVDPDTGKATHVIAGTDNLKDWANNLLIPLGLHHHTNRYKNSEKIHKKANEKYGKDKVDLVTHSQSGNIAENLQKRNLVGGENTTLNPAILGSHNKKLKVVKSRLDPVSLLTKTNKNDVVLKESSYNPLTEHSTAILGSGINTEIQSILFSRPEWTLTKAKTWLKKHGYKTDVDKKPEHYRFRQTEPEKYRTFRTKHIGDNISFIIGIKRKGGNINNMNETDLIKRMAKLSHDLHLHHVDNGHGEDILKAYKLVGHGIKESVCGGQISGQGKKSGNKDIDNFNGWFKAVGQKFKPLMKYANPVLQAGSDRAVEMVGDLGKTPQEKAAEKAAELFTGKKEKPAPVQESPLLTTNEKRRLKAKQRQMDEREEEEYQSSKPRRRPTYYDEEDEEDYEPPPRQSRQSKQVYENTPETSTPKPPVYLNSFSNQPSSYERSFQSQYGRGLAGKKMKEMYGSGTGKDLGANLAGNIGRLADAGTNKVINDYLGSGLKKKRVKGCGTGKDLGKNLAGNIGRLADAGTNKVINDYLGGSEGSGLKKKGRFVKGSQAARDHMAAIRAKRGKGF